MTIEQSRAIETYEGIEEGSLGLDSSEILPPRVRFSGKTGLFKFLGEEETFESLEAVPLLKLRPTRLKFAADEESSEIECRSEDGIMPVDTDQAASIGAGPTCKGCPFSKFGRDAKGNATAPSCTEQYNIAMASIPADAEEEPMPFLFSTKSLGIAPLSSALGVIEKWHRKTKKPTYAFTIELSAGSLITQGKRSWYPLVVKPVAESHIPDDLLPLYRELWYGMAEIRAKMKLSFEEQPAFDAEGNLVAS